MEGDFLKIKNKGAVRTLEQVLFDSAAIAWNSRISHEWAASQGCFTKKKST
jgi:hypothetical protein